MKADCPICGNELVFSSKAKSGRCVYCKSKYVVVKSKKRVELEEAPRRENK